MEHQTSINELQALCDKAHDETHDDKQRSPRRIVCPIYLGGTSASAFESTLGTIQSALTLEQFWEDRCHCHEPAGEHGRDLRTI